MFGQESTTKPDYFNVYVTRGVDNFNRHQIVANFRTGVEDVVYVLISEAEREVARRGNGHYLATDNKNIAKKYQLELIRQNGQLKNKI